MTLRRRTGLLRTALIDLEAIASNAMIASGDDPAGAAADLRANAYGHGTLAVARALESAGIGAVVVSTSEEAGALLAAGIRVPVVEAADELGRRDAGFKLVHGRNIFAAAEPARATMRLSGEVISVKSVAAGIGVSYGYTYRTKRRTRLALVALGFADGIPRSSANRAPIRIGGFTGMVSGRVAMDQFVVDLGEAEAEVGDEAVVFGSADRGDPSLISWSDTVAVHPLVLLARLGRRITRVEGSL
jgi:alanine racemase